jgi:GT2 family glycosyltransferase
MLKKEPNVTIITPIYKTNLDFIKKQVEVIKSQEYSGKITHVYINDNVKEPLKIKGINIINNKKNIGLTAGLKKGFKIAKTEIVVSLMDDCLPSSRDWLRKLIKPLENPDMAATSSKVELPKWFYDKFQFLAKALTAKEQTVLTVRIDVKGCAYKKSIIKEYGYFDTKNFRSGGDDADLCFRLVRKYKIKCTDAKVYHLHWTNNKERIKKEIQYAKLAGRGARKNFRIYPFDFQASVIVQLGLFFLLFIFIFVPIISYYWIILAMFIVANRRFPVQLKKLWKDPRIILIPFFNLIMYFVYVIFFLIAFIFKIEV